MAKKEFKSPIALIEASRLADKVSVLPKRKTTLEAFTGKKERKEANTIPTGSQHDFDTIPVLDQHHFGIKATPSQHHASQFKNSNTIPTPSQHHIRLSPKQLIVYDFLSQIGGQGTFNKPFIERNTGIAYGTIRDIVRKFQKLKIIDICYDKFAKCYEYKINTKIKIKRDNPDTIPTPFQHHFNMVPASSQHHPSTMPYISSSSCINTATENVKQKLETHPELGYWRQKGLSTKQVEQWIKIADSSLENMIQYLCYCRFEMVDLGREESEPIKDVFNWFFRIIERTGGYPKPKEYQSYQKKQLAAERELVEQKEKEAQETQELFLRKIKAERDKAFYDMMNNSDGELYQKCYAKLNNFQKRRSSGKGFSMSMRTVFDQLMDEEDEA